MRRAPLGPWALLLFAASACTRGASAERAPRQVDASTATTPATATSPAAPPTPAPVALPPQRAERALWALQGRLAAARAHLRAASRLTPGEPFAEVAEVTVALAAGARPWTARLRRCQPPAQGDCHAGWEAGVCECAVLVLTRGDDERSLVISETAALGRPRLQAVPRPDGNAGLWLGADLYDRAQPWPRVGFVIEGPDPPVLAWRGEIGSCRFAVEGDPEDERAPAQCDPAETAVRYEGDTADLVIEIAGATRRFPRAPTGSLRH